MSNGTNTTQPPYRKSFYDGDLSAPMFQMLEYASKNYPDFPKSLAQIHAFDNDYVVPHRGNVILIPAAVTLGITIAVVTCRLWTRYMRKHGLGLDDWLILTATMAAVGYTVVELLGVKSGCIGMHCYDCTYGAMVLGYKLEYISLVVYLFAVVMTKLSILAFLWHLLPRTDKVFRWTVLGSAAAIMLSALATFLVVTFNCDPVPAVWNLIARSNTQHGCHSISKIMIGWSVVLAVTDVWLLALPTFLVWRLRLPLHNKIGLTVMFSLGLLATVASFVKAWAAVRAYNTYDLTWHFVEVMVASHIEITLGIIAASLPALNSSFNKYIPRSWSTVLSWASQASRSGKSKKSFGSTGNSSFSNTAHSTNPHESISRMNKKGITIISTVESKYASGTHTIDPFNVSSVDTKCYLGSPIRTNWPIPPPIPPSLPDFDFGFDNAYRCSSVYSQVSIDLPIQSPAQPPIVEEKEYC